MNFNIARVAGLGAASVLAASLFAGPALADGMLKKGKVKAPEAEARPCTVSANVGLTTDYVFRGISQTFEDPAIQGGFDVTCGRFYAGVWASNVDFGAVGPASTVANIEIDLYAGFKTTMGPISWDLGVIYYSYPGQNSPGFDVDYFEFKVGASGEIWKGGTLSGTVFYSPEYTFSTGEVWTYEIGFSQALPKLGMFSPTFSALYGHSDFQDLGFLSYSYWNAGVTLGFMEKWSLDLRYWGSDNDGFAAGPLGDDRFVGTLKFTY
jgi:uncharacterized protein (TIGR02001 family)